MSPPSDGARPVAYLVGTPMNDKVLGLSIPNDGSHIKLKVNERMDLCTAADYDALRAERDKLQKDVHGWREQHECTVRGLDALRAEVERWRDRVSVMSEHVQSQIDKTNEQRARAEAAEAKVAALRVAASMLRDEVVVTGLHGDDAHDEFCPTCLAIRDLDAALNERDGE